ncbi:MAG TPA: nucleoside triphosphate pyrophosphatase [Conexibacter sp.]|nr:nucleoside triphosphate pyrophosphatase [Conexibacter sp.]
MRLVLASRSPQRRAILEQLGVAFEVVVSDAEELAEGDDPVAVAVENARRKAQAVARTGPVGSGCAPVRLPAAGRASAPPPARSASPPPARSAAPSSPSMPVVGVDTVVVLDGVIYGKPADAAEARAVLSRLSGRVHEVVSGIAVVEEGETRTACATTRVSFRALDAATLDWYLATEEWRERAGGYAIQGRGAALVAGIEGDYLNVVGLPVTALLELLPSIVQGDAHPPV